MDKKEIYNLIAHTLLINLSEIESFDDPMYVLNEKTILYLGHKLINKNPDINISKERFHENVIKTMQKIAENLNKSDQSILGKYINKNIN